MTQLYWQPTQYHERAGGNILWDASVDFFLKTLHCGWTQVFWTSCVTFFSKEAAMNNSETSFFQYNWLLLFAAKILFFLFAKFQEIFKKGQQWQGLSRKDSTYEDCEPCLQCDPMAAPSMKMWRMGNMNYFDDAKFTFIWAQRTWRDFHKEGVTTPICDTCFWQSRIVFNMWTWYEHGYFVKMGKDNWRKIWQRMVKDVMECHWMGCWRMGKARIQLGKDREK